MIGALRSEPGEQAEVRRSIRQLARIDRPYLAMNVLAATLASYGLFANSAAVVIGAMIVALLLGPIVGVALAIADNDRTLLLTAARTLLAGIFVVYATAILIGLIHRDLPLTDEILARTRPTILDLMIALAGGAAGAYATVRPRLGLAVVGVAVATALVPPLAASAILAARSEFHLSSRALLLAFTNIVAIQFASSVVLLLSGYRERGVRSGGLWRWLRRNALTAIALITLGTVLTINLRDVVSEQLYRSDVKATIEREITRHHDSAHIDGVRFETDPDTGILIIRAVVRAVDDIDSAEVAAIEAQLPNPPSGRDFELRIRQIRIDVITSHGALIDTGDSGDTGDSDG